MTARSLARAVSWLGRGFRACGTGGGVLASGERAAGRYPRFLRSLFLSGGLGGDGAANGGSCESGMRS